MVSAKRVLEIDTAANMTCRRNSAEPTSQRASVSGWSCVCCQHILTIAAAFSARQLVSCLLAVIVQLRPVCLTPWPKSMSEWLVRSTSACEHYLQKTPFSGSLTLATRERRVRPRRSYRPPVTERKKRRPAAQEAVVLCLTPVSLAPWWSGLAGPCYAAWIAALVQCPYFALFQLRMLCAPWPPRPVLVHWEADSLLPLVSVTVGWLRCPGHALHDWPHVLSWTFHLASPQLGSRFFSVFTCLLVTGDR